MKNRIIIGAVVLASASALAVAASRSRESLTTIAAPEHTLPKVERSAITQLDIQIPGQDPISLSKEPESESWRMTAPLDTKADPSTVGAILKTLETLQVVGVAATRKENHARLQVTPELGIHVVAKSGDSTALDLYIGAAKTGGTMVRQEGEEVALTAAGSIRYAFDKELRLYRNRVITDIDPAKVSHLSVQSAHGAFAFHRVDGAFQQDAKEAPIADFNGDKVQDLVNTFARLRAMGFAPPSASTQDLKLDAPKATLVMTLEDGSTTTVLLGDRAANQDYLSVVGDPVVYQVAAATGDMMQPKATAFAGAKVPTPEPAAPQPFASGPNDGRDPHGLGGNLPPQLVEELKRAAEQAQNKGTSDKHGQPQAHATQPSAH